MKDETFAELVARMKDNGCADPCAKPVIGKGRAADDYDALWHHASCLDVWGELGWQRVAQQMSVRGQGDHR